MESTPTTDMGESEESPEEVSQEPAPTQPAPVSSSAAIRTSEPPAKVQPKGNLVVNPTVLREPTVTIVWIMTVFDVAFLVYKRARREIRSDFERQCSEEEGNHS